MWRQSQFDNGKTSAHRSLEIARIGVFCGIGFWVLGTGATALDNWADPAQTARHLTDITSTALILGLMMGVVGFGLGIRSITTRLGKIAVALTVAPVTAALCLLLLTIGEFLNKLP